MKYKSIGLKTFAEPRNKTERALDFLKDGIAIALMCNNGVEKTSLTSLVLFAIGFILLKTQVKVTMEDK